MKNIYTLSLVLLISSAIFAQSKTQKSFEKIRLQLSTQQSSPSKPAQPTLSKTPGDTLWSEDFTGGLPTGWSTFDNTGNGFDWVLDSGLANLVADFTNTTPIASTSGGNFMLLFGDAYNVGGGSTDMNAYFQTAAIPLNNVGGVSVNFQQKVRRCCAITPVPVAVLSVSTDSTFASNVQEFDIRQGIGKDQSPDPMNVSINISGVAANFIGNIYLRFHIKSGSSHYFWMIDDIQLVESPLNDIVTSAGSYHFFGVQYTRIPVAQIQPASFSMIYNVIGSATQPNTNLTVDINDGSTSIFNTSSPDFNATTFQNDTIFMNNAWAPPTTLGIPYAVTLDILSDSADITPANNAITFPPFEVSQFIMALDDYSATPGSDGNSQGFEAGNQFTMAVDQQLFGIDVVAGSGTTVGALVEVRIYETGFNTNPFIFTLVDNSNFYIITAADIGVVHTYPLLN